MTARLKEFSPINPSGDAPGMEPVRLDVLKAAVANASTPPEMSTIAPQTRPAVPLVAKNLRLPADLVDFIDWTYTKEKRTTQQEAYAEALEAYFRGMMRR